MMKEKDVFLNRELSWLSFNDRVLEKARDEAVPLFERLKFCAIYCSNLDEFFMVRMGTLADQALLRDVIRDNKTELTPKQQLHRASERIAEESLKLGETVKTVEKKLSGAGIKRCSLKKADSKQLKYWKNVFDSEIKSKLSPQVISEGHAYPFLQGLTTYVYLRLQNRGGEDCFGLVPVPEIVQKMFFLPGAPCSFVLAEDIILRFADELFPQYRIEQKTKLRLTRNADISLDEGIFDYKFDYVEAMKLLLKRRRQLAPLRVQLSCAPDKKLKTHLEKQFKLKDNMIYVQQIPMDMSYVYELARQATALFSQHFYTPQPAPIPQSGVIRHLDRQDMLLFYPYESFETVLNLLDEAAEDKTVRAISISLYRVAKDSRVIAALLKAAQNQKDVTVVVELRARFDEQNNIDWAKRLEDAGCNVIYGLGDLKVHAKLILIIRAVHGKQRYISHVGTGNFNENTAKLYTDVSYLTSSEEVAREVAEVFAAFRTGILPRIGQRLLTSPLTFKPGIMALIDREIAKGEEGRIFIKCNSVSDRDIIINLFEASRAGVKITMIVRGICCLCSGIEGHTENIRVISQVGRLLEHSRIFIFGTESEQRIFIGSADFLTRNTERRIEATVEIVPKYLKEKVNAAIEIMLRDNFNSHIQQPDGSYSLPKHEGENFNSQEYLFGYFRQQSQKPRFKFL